MRSCLPHVSYFPPMFLFKSRYSILESRTKPTQASPSSIAVINSLGLKLDFSASFSLSISKSVQWSFMMVSVESTSTGIVWCEPIATKSSGPSSITPFILRLLFSSLNSVFSTFKVMFMVTLSLFPLRSMSSLPLILRSVFARTKSPGCTMFDRYHRSSRLSTATFISPDRRLRLSIFIGCNYNRMDSDII